MELLLLFDFNLITRNQHVLSIISFTGDDLTSTIPQPLLPPLPPLASSLTPPSLSHEVTLFPRQHRQVKKPTSGKINW